MLTGLLIILPLVFILLLLALTDSKHVKTIALLATLAEFGIAIALFYHYLYSCHCTLGFHPEFFRQLGINFTLSVDGLGMLMILLTCFLFPLVIYTSFDKNLSRPKSFYILLLLMEMAFIGVFTATDVLLFYIFWELSIFPIYFITALWGKNAKAISLEFLIYTIVGSLFMLVAIVYLYTLTPGTHSFSFLAFYNLTLDYSAQVLVFLAFFLAFAIKIPLFPLHSWLPKTHTASPTQGSMLLAGVMLKMGIFGILRFILPLCPSVLTSWSFYVILLSIAGILYSSLIAIKQTELKRLIAFSSLAHMGLISAGVFSGNFNGMEGAVFQMLSHGINVAGAFFCYEILYRRTHTGTIASLGGIASKAPIFSVCFMIILLANIALPLTNGFVGEFLLLLGIFEFNHFLAVFAGLTIILSAVYVLWMYQRVMFGSVTAATEDFKEITIREIIVLIPLIIMIFWMGVYPKMFLNIAEPYVRSILHSPLFSLN